MKKIFYLKTCDTCKRILNEINTEGFELREIKSEAITKDELEIMYQFTQSYDVLFSRRAQNYKKLGLKDQNLTEEQIKNYILSDYTFLKRPVLIDGDRIFVGSEKKTVENLKTHLPK